MNGEPTIQELLTRLAVLERKRDVTPPLRPRRRAPRGWRRLGAAVAVALLIALVPLGLLAAGPFTDLDPASPHNGNIAAIQAAGITKGCDPPDFTQYCPKDYVTREEMASFLARTAGLGGNPPVANARTAETAANAAHATTADSATNAQAATNAATLQGYAPSGLVRVARATTTASVFPPSQFVTYGTPLTIEAPAAGFVLVTGEITFSSGAGCACTVIAEARHIQSGQTTLETGPTIAPNAWETSSFAYVFPVTAGTNTFDFRIRQDTGPAGAVHALAGQMAALYVPFGSTGGSSLNTP